MTLYEIVEDNIKNCGDMPAYEYFNKEVSYIEFGKNIDAVANALVAKGIKSGDKVGICLPNSPYMMDILYAVNKIGAVAVMLNPKSPLKEIKLQLKMTECKMVFYSSIVSKVFKHIELDSVAVSIFKGLPLLFKFVCLKKVFPYYFARNNYRNFIKAGKEIKDIQIARDDMADAVMIFSGGTSGECKAIVHSSASFNNSAINCIETEKPLPDRLSMLAVLPAFHIFGLTVAIHLPIVAKGKAVLVPFFHMGTLAKIIAKKCPTFIAAVPTIIERLLECERFKRYVKKGIDFSEFRHGFIGGDHLKEEVRDRFNDIIKKCGGNGYISMGYGMSECCPISVNDRNTTIEKSVGRPFGTVEVMIFDDENQKEATEGEFGEIWISSSYSMKYTIDSEKNKHPLVSYKGKEWVATKDMGYFKDGLIFYECRERRIIKVSGHSIFAESVEKVVKAHNKVKDAYAVPVKHEARGYGVFLFVTVFDENDKNEKLEKEIIALCEANLVIYAKPLGIKFINEEDVPITPMLKISYGKLEERLKNIRYK